MKYKQKEITFFILVIEFLNVEIKTRALLWLDYECRGTTTLYLQCLVHTYLWGLQYANCCSNMNVMMMQYNWINSMIFNVTFQWMHSPSNLKTMRINLYKNDVMKSKLKYNTVTCDDMVDFHPNIYLTIKL